MDYGERQERAQYLIKLFRSRSDKNRVVFEDFGGGQFTWDQLANEVELMTDLGRSLVATAGFVIQALNSTPDAVRPSV